MNELTRVLSAMEQGDPQAADRLLPLVYEELRRLATARLRHEKPGQTLQATALVHEAYLRLLGPLPQAPTAEDSQVGQPWNSRGHFFAAAAEAMRRILIDGARRKGAQRRGANRNRCQLLDGDLSIEPAGDELLDLDEALTRLAQTERQAAEIVKLRLFAGMTIDEIAAVQGISPRTVKRHWAYARAWLGRELADYDQPES